MTRCLWVCLLALLLQSPVASVVLAAELPAAGTVEVLFTPWDDAEGALVREIGRAKKTLHVQAYLITSRTIAAALREAHARGVKIMVLADREMMMKNEKSLVPGLHEAGIDVRLETRYASAHNKIILIDVAGEAPVVITGSYNFSYSAQARNSENLLIMRRNPTLTRRYLGNWKRHHNEALPYAKTVLR